MPIPINYDYYQNLRTYFAYKAVFTPKECNRIISFGEEIGFMPSILAHGQIDKNSRTSLNAWLDVENQPWIIERFTDVLRLANNEFNFDIESFDLRFQLTKYPEGAYYHWHQDGGIDLPKRKISMVLNLSENFSYTGGELQFFGARNEKTENDIGSMVVFPSFEFHRVTPVKTGTRYSLVTWVNGHPFR